MKKRRVNILVDSLRSYRAVAQPIDGVENPFRAPGKKVVIPTAESTKVVNRAKPQSADSKPAPPTDD